MKSKKTVIILITFLLSEAGIFLFYNSKVFCQQQATYVGIEKCRACHPQQYEQFQQRKFSRSWKTLKMRKKEKNPECLKCHVTGYGQPGGFVSEEATPHLLYKQCEACHGPGSLHADNPADVETRHRMKEYIQKPNGCTNCHRGVFTHRISIKEY